MARTDAQKRASNNYQKNSEDRIVLKYPKGMKDRIIKLAKSKGFDNFGTYIKNLIQIELDKFENK